MPVSLPLSCSGSQRNTSAAKSARDKRRRVLREEAEMTHSSSFLKPISAFRKELHSYPPHIRQRQASRTPRGLTDPSNASLLSNVSAASLREPRAETQS